MKAIFKILVALMLVLSLAVCMGSCGDNTQTEDTAAGEVTEDVAQTTGTGAQTLETIDNTPIELPLVP